MAVANSWLHEQTEVVREDGSHEDDDQRHDDHEGVEGDVVLQA